MDGEADSGFDMDSAVDSISSDLFGSSESEESTEEQEDIEFSEESEEETLESSEDKEEVKKDEDTEEKQEEEVKLKEAPNSWKKEMHESWSKLDKDTQDYIEQRESQMKDGLDQDRTDSNLGRIMRDTMAPYSQALKSSGVDEPTMVKNLLGAHWKLSTSSPEERTELMHKLASNYGVTLSPQAEGEQTEVDPAVAQLQNELNRLKSKLDAQEQESLQESKSKVTSEVNDFADKNEYFDEVSEQMSAFLIANPAETLESAYEKAIWANPVTRQKEIDRVAKESESISKAKAEKKLESAKKARSTNVKNRDTSNTPTGPKGTMDDTMRDTYRNIQTRN